MVNHLANSESLYLRKHAHNPIDWWYWGDEALNLAKQQNKPIFLSIGYSSCHWCTVMEGEAFSDTAIAEYLNQNFIPIKVDREERPDIDSIYMQALQIMVGQGGWPLNIFLTPGDLVPFYAGTYFPIESRYNRPGFLDILQGVRRFYDVEKQKLQNFKQEICHHLQQSAVFNALDPNVLTRELLFKGIEANMKVLVPRDLGNPSFPMIPYVNLILQGSIILEESSDDYEELCSQRGKTLVLGGIFDHVAGGFHRYTIDSTWTVPHFEKMLYDNGQILEYLGNLASHKRQGTEPTATIDREDIKPGIKRAISLTIDWLAREMRSPEGYFYAAQDADSFATGDSLEPEEGLFYVWNYRELQDMLTSEELGELQGEFRISVLGNFEGQNVLQRFNDGELSPNLESILGKLFTKRYGENSTDLKTFAPAKNQQEAQQVIWKGRIPPVTDTKMITAWNSLIISGLARIYGVLGNCRALELATKCAEFILENQFTHGIFHRLNYTGQVTVPAQSEDYALFIKALLDLHTVCPEQDRWLTEAIKIQEEFDQRLWHESTGGYYNSSPEAAPDLLVREKAYMDSAIPSANGTAIANLVRISLLTDNLDYRDRSLQGLCAFATIMERSPQACPTLFTALDWLLNGNLVKTRSETFKDLISRYFPTTVYRIVTDLPEGVVGLTCNETSCLEPATSLAELIMQLN